MTLVNTESETQLSPNATGKGKRGWGAQLTGLVISLICLAFIASQINLDELGNALKNFQWPYLLAGVCSLAFGYAFRIVRWSVMLRAAGASISVGTCAAPFLGSIALNNVLPFRMGDVVRAMVFPSAIGLGRLTSTGSLVMERLVDLLTLLACLALGLVSSSHANPPDWVGQTAISLAIVGSIALLLVFLLSGTLSKVADRMQSSDCSLAIRNRILGAIRDLFLSFEAMSRTPVLVALFLLSILVWVGESGIFYLLLLGFGFNADPALAAVVMAIATLSTLVPSSPGYVGPFHLAAFAAVSMLGGTSAQAASFAVLSHLGLWLPTTLAGVVAIMLRPELFRGLLGKGSTR